MAFVIDALVDLHELHGHCWYSSTRINEMHVVLAFVPVRASRQKLQRFIYGSGTLPGMASAL
jgi:hypothetical protein